MYEIADAIGNTMGGIWDFLSDMSILKMLMIAAIVVAAVVLFQFKVTRVILGVAIGLAVLAVAFALIYGFIYVIGGEGIIQLIVALGLVSALAPSVFGITITIFV